VTGRSRVKLAARESLLFHRHENANGRPAGDDHDGLHAAIHAKADGTCRQGAAKKIDVCARSTWAVMITMATIALLLMCRMPRI
jgi:hypothetical protein